MRAWALPALCVGVFVTACTMRPPANNNANTNTNANANDNDPGTPGRVDVIVVGSGEVTQSVDGAFVTLTATPDEGWRFSAWTGSVLGSQNPVTIRATESSEVTATFLQIVVPNDADSDGVLDESDDCPETPTGSTVNTDGCAASQLDDDGDGVTNDRDLCAGTPPGTAVNTTGCVTVVPSDDNDGDGVPNGVDQCANTPEGVAVDAEGCPVENPDSDADGVDDRDDTCPNTPAGATVNAMGCAATQRDTDGDGVNDAADQCPGTRPGTTVAGNGCIPNTTPPPPPPPPPVDPLDNDSCQTPTAITDGIISFTSLTATNDNIVDPGPCSSLSLEADIWYCYTATCSQLATVSMCGSTDYDAQIAVYAGCDCPTQQAITCDDDYCAAGGAPRIRFPVTAGSEYLIRVAGFDGDTGNGSIEITCGPAPDVANICSEAISGCFAGHGGAGCTETDCCETICEIDSYCCEVQWDDLCAEEADAACNGTFPVCSTSEESCDLAHLDPGCAADGCCFQVCNEDPYCCLVEWDDACVDLAAMCQD
jgi:hypothetical protein